MSGSEADLVQIAQLVGVMLAAGLVAGFVAGLFGIGGGFVIVPALLLVFHVFDVDDNVLTHLAIGTSLATIIFTSLRSVHAHHKKGAVDFQIIKDWLPWLTVGVVFGIILARYMDGRSMKWVFSAGVFLMGLHFTFPVLKRKTPPRSGQNIRKCFCQRESSQIDLLMIVDRNLIHDHTACVYLYITHEE